MSLLIRQLKMKNVVDVNIFEELATCSNEDGDSKDNKNSKISSEILIKEDSLGENAADEERKEDNVEGAEEEKAKIDEENDVSSDSHTLTAECQSSSVLEEKELLLSAKDQQFGSHKKQKEEVLSTLDVPLVEFGHVQKRKPLPTPPNQTEDEAGGQGSISANEGSADVKITIQHEDEPPGDDDDDNISPKDILCFAWQIAQGMVSEQL